jgi:hypothetical protein
MEYMGNITKINKALKKIDFKIVEDDRQMFYGYVMDKHYKVEQQQETYPHYFKFLYSCIWNKLD